MWTTREDEELAVFADELQQRGDPWGELIATSMALASASEPARVEALSEQLGELQRSEFDPWIGLGLRDYTEHIQTFWTHGVLVGLQVNWSIRAPVDTFAQAASLLRLPLARFVWFVGFNPWHIGDDRISAETIASMLLAPELVARPQVIVLDGSASMSSKRHVESMVASLQPVERGVAQLSITGAPRPLPLVPGDKGTRLQAIQRLHTRVRERGLSRHDQIMLGRALWDTSTRVQLAALDSVSELDGDAGVFVSGILRMQGNSQVRARKDGLLRELAARPEVVERVRDNFIPGQGDLLGWLRREAKLDERSLARSFASPTLPNLVQLARRGAPLRSSLFERAIAWLRKQP